MTTLLVIVISFIIGMLFYDFLVYYKNWEKQKSMVKDEHSEKRKVLIECHNECYYAFSFEDEFLGQDQSLSDLILKVMKDDPDIIVASDDQNVINELRKLFSSQELSHTAP